MFASRRLLVACAIVAGLAVAPGCQPRAAAPELLTVTEVVPRVVQSGDRVDVSGVNLPVGRIDDARVLFRGDLHRPGQPAVMDVTFESGRASLERDRVSFLADEELLERVTGVGDEAVHTTFRGKVEVRIPTNGSGLPVVGSVPGEVTLEFVPKAGARALRDARAEESKAASTYLGVSWSALEVEGEGLEARAIEPSSLAARAGLQPGDVLERIDGLTILRDSDFVLRGDGQPTKLTIRRGDERLDKTIETSGFQAESTANVHPGLVTLLTALVVLGLVSGPAGAWFSWIVHRLHGALLPHRARGASVFAAVVRAATHDAARDGVHAGETLRGMAPALVFAGVTVTFAALPFVELTTRAELDIGILYLVSITALVTMALLTGGWSTSGSPVLGRIRAVLDVLVCQLPAVAALGAIVVRVGSLRAHDIVRTQSERGGGVWSTGGWPWAWNALKNPQLFVLFGLFFVTALVDGSRQTPRSAERSAESSKAGSVLFFFAEWLHLFVMCSLGTIAFLGGYSLPGVDAARLGVSGAAQLAGCVLFLAKCWALVFAVLVARAALPRVRPNLLLKLGLSVALPASIVALGITWLTIAYPLLPAAERALGWTTLGTATALFALIVGSLFSGESSGSEPDRRARARLSPFL